jgi:hypothetical protein
MLLNAVPQDVRLLCREAWVGIIRRLYVLLHATPVLSLPFTNALKAGAKYFCLIAATSVVVGACLSFLCMLITRLLA